MRVGNAYIRAVLVMLLGVVGTSDATAQRRHDFSYFGPGDLQPMATEKGVRDRRVFFPDFAFPLRVGPHAGSDGQPLHAYLNSQIFRAPGVAVNGIENYVYPWRDNYCESQRGWSMPNCPAGIGHQGQDIRPSSPDNQVWDVLAVDDGEVISVNANTTVIVRSSANNGVTCRYLHMQPVLVKKQQKVVRGVTVMGKVSNFMGGVPGTSIHLHFDCEATHPELRRKVFMPVYTSLVASYRRAWGLPDLVAQRILARDPEREAPSDAGGCATSSEVLEATRGLNVSSRWVHNCSEMGAVVDGSSLKLVYLRPQTTVVEAARRNPVLVQGNLQDSRFRGKAIRFNKDCNDPAFDISGDFSLDAQSFVLTGERAVLGSNCKGIDTTIENLVFERAESTGGRPQGPDGQPSPSVVGLTCPFGLKPGDKPRIIGGVEFPPKSERSCNFTAITLPGGQSFESMPQYVQQWPGILSEVLTDRFDDQIITLRTAEAGVGLWYYWVMNRARHGEGLEHSGFGQKPTPTLAQLARAMAGAGRSADYVQKVYLAPYVKFASTYFSRDVDDDERIDMSIPENRWNLARTMFRLESGREPVISRKQFECGIALGLDVNADFQTAGIEKNPQVKAVFSKTRGLAYYIDECGKSGDQPPPSTPSTAVDGPIAELNRKLEIATSQISVLMREKSALAVEKTSLEERLNSSLSRLQSLEREVSRLKSQEPESTEAIRSDHLLQSLQAENKLLAARIQSTERELLLMTQLLQATREICRLKSTNCG